MGAADLVANRGEIVAARGIALDGHVGRLDNRGQIDGQSKGFDLSGPEGLSLRNRASGEIEGALGGKLSGWDMLVVNEGRVQGSAGTALQIVLDLGEAQAAGRIVNEGLMVGDLRCRLDLGQVAEDGGAGLTVINAGRVRGSVILAGLDDRYLAREVEGRGGWVAGWVKAGGGEDLLRGARKADRFDGGGGADTLRGGEGADRLLGGRGDDLLSCGGGADHLTGGAGDDILTGGAQADRFVFGTGAGQDRITDFQAGLDRIDLRALSVDGFDDLALRRLADDRFALDLRAEGGGGIEIVLATGQDLRVDDFLL